MGDLKPLSAEELDDLEIQCAKAEASPVHSVPKSYRRLIAQARRALELEAENRKLREALEKIRDMKYPEDDWDEPGMDAVEIATAALGGEG